MKKTSLYILSLIFITIACSKKTELSKDSLKVQSYLNLGTAHNEFLKNAKDNFEVNASVTSTSDKIDYIYNFNSKYIDKLDFTIQKKALMREQMNISKGLVKTSNLTSGSFYQSLSEDSIDEGTIFEKLDTLRDFEVISDFAHTLLTNFANDLKANYESNLSDADLKLNLIQLIATYDNHGYPEDSGEGAIIGTIFAISLSSLEWWEENNDSTEVAPWVAADCAGALVSGVSTACIQYGFNGEVDWNIACTSALVGAVSASTGLVGRIARWFR
jgi:hypothetical protein